jgi:hypothetical protein
MSPESVWEVLARIVWNEQVLGMKNLFVKLIIPSVLETFVKNSMPVVRAPIELIELKWSDDDLLEMWKERLGKCSEPGTDWSSIASVFGPANPNITGKRFFLRRKWKDACRREVRSATIGVDEYIVSLSEGSPKCLMALGRTLLQYGMDKCWTLGEENICKLTSKEFYEVLATLLEAYYGLRADPIPECQEVIRKQSGSGQPHGL